MSAVRGRVMLRRKTPKLTRPPRLPKKRDGRTRTGVDG